MAHDTETFLLEKFCRGAESCKIHTGKLKKLTQVLGELKLHNKLETTGLFRVHLYDLNNLLDECQRLARKSPFIGLKSLLNLGKSLNQVKDTLLALEGRQDPDQVPWEALTPPSPSQQASALQVSDQVRHYLSPAPPRVWGFNEEIIQLERLVVTQSKFKCIGVTGIAGIGKTTLCDELLRSSEEVKKHFLIRVSIPLAKNDTYEDVVKAALDELGVEEETVEMTHREKGLPGLVCSLYVRLMGKRYLVVLDGVTSRDAWYKNLEAEVPSNPEWGNSLAYGFPKGDGGVVIVTSRDEEVAKNMVVSEEENLHRLLPLADEDHTWNIFVDGLDMDQEEFEPSEEIRKEILKKCGGVPLAARMMGKIMKELVELQRLPSEAFQALQFSDK